MLRRRVALVHANLRLLALLSACTVSLGACGGSSKGGASRSSSASSAAAATPLTTATTAAPASASASASASAGTSVSASAGGVTATLVAGTHTPRANANWPLRFSVTRAGRPVTASVSYEYLFSGQVVARRNHYTFNGSFHDTFVWPSTAIGYPLTFRALLAAGTSTIALDYPVQVSR